MHSTMNVLWYWKLSAWHPAVDPSADNEVGVCPIRGDADLIAVLDADAQVPHPHCERFLGTGSATGSPDT